MTKTLLLLQAFPVLSGLYSMPGKFSKYLQYTLSSSCLFCLCAFCIHSPGSVNREQRKYLSLIPKTLIQPIRKGVYSSQSGERGQSEIGVSLFISLLGLFVYIVSVISPAMHDY